MSLSNTDINVLLEIAEDMALELRSYEQYQFGPDHSAVKEINRNIKLIEKMKVINK